MIEAVLLRTEKGEGRRQKDLWEAGTDVMGWGRKEGGLGQGVVVRPERDGGTGALR